ncbi:50S ribosomal protein L14e [Candidatus Woesearchaeota archaeon]|nr:50S ribosomal protein L14e [Candidatus Woesearchaeota archaeon]
MKKTSDVKRYSFEVGRICIKTAGREAGKTCAVVDILGNNFVLIDGNVKRRKCNIFHLETLDKTIKIKKNESTENVKKELTTLGYGVTEKKRTTKKTTKEKPAKKRNTPSQEAFGKSFSKTNEKSLNKTNEKSLTKEEKKETPKKKEQAKKEKKKTTKKSKK